MNKILKTVWLLVLMCLWFEQNRASFAVGAPQNKSEDWNAAVGYWQAFGLMPVWNDEETKLLESIPSDVSVPLPVGVQEITDKARLALSSLAAANRIKRCDWQLDYSQGPNLLLPHLQKARDLARLSNLRARYRFANGDHSAALDDIDAALRLSRAAGTDPVLIGLLVEGAIDLGVVDTIAAYLSRLNAVERARLAALLQELPQRGKMTDAMQMERQVFGGWLEMEFKKATVGKQPQDSAAGFLNALGALMSPEDRQVLLVGLDHVNVGEAQKAVDTYLDNCNQIIEILKSPFDIRRKKFELFDAKLNVTKDENAQGLNLSKILLPAVHTVSNREESWIAREHLLAIALAGIDGGTSGMETAARKKNLNVTCRERNGGWELSIPLAAQEKVETLVIGKGFRYSK